ncbi:unnamed protein product [Linum trigynum]|uniref:Uncharacterized protein n=1 Tax=Linum trigynum TaxID=586398 RepID=A0AAV2FMT3_9ROSI
MLTGGIKSLPFLECIRKICKLGNLSDNLTNACSINKRRSSSREHHKTCENKAGICRGKVVEKQVEADLVKGSLGMFEDDRL